MENIANYLWPAGINTPTPRIDMWRMTPTSHIFGYWENGTKAGPMCPPDKQISLTIDWATGNYPNAPQPIEFYTWIKKCVHNPELLTVDNYNQTFNNQGVIL